MDSQLYPILKRLTKQEILRYSKEYCEHRQPLLVHPSCLAKKIKYDESVGFLDIETSNFSASFGVVVTWAVCDIKGTIDCGWLEDKDFKAGKGSYDKRLLQECVEAMRKYDRLVVYWGKDKRFDIPFLRTRAVSNGVNFPLWQERIVNDLYDTVRNKFKFGRNSLAAACTQFGIASKDTPLSPQTWMDATIGRDKKSIHTILKHNKEDVLSTRDLWIKIEQYNGSPKTSI